MLIPIVIPMFEKRLTKRYGVGAIGLVILAIGGTLFIGRYWLPSFLISAASMCLLIPAIFSQRVGRFRDTPYLKIGALLFLLCLGLGILAYAKMPPVGTQSGWIHRE
jgi:hypothetical protein